MSQSFDRRRLVPLSAITKAEDRVLALTTVALGFVLLLSVARCSSGAVSTVDAELDASNGRLVTAARAGTANRSADGGVAVPRPRPVPRSDAETAGGDASAATAGSADATAMTFVAPPRQGAPASAAGPAPVDGGALPVGGDLQNRLTGLTVGTGGWFGPDSSQVGEEARPVLDEVAELLRAQPSARVEVGGHTDTNGSPEANQRLSQSRADVVRQELVERGVQGDRLVANGYGQSRPRQSNDTVAGRASNRRIELTVLG